MRANNESVRPEGKFSRRNFLVGVGAVLGMSGCRIGSVVAASPRLKIGVISDIHVTTTESTAKFRRALRYFRGKGADAVMVAGDLCDWGLKSGLRCVKEAWDAEMDGTGIVPLFITGNHDYDGWWYGDMTLDMHLQGYSEDDALTRHGLAKCWEEIFREPFADIRVREVKGVRFVSCEWQVEGKEGNDARVAEWFENNRGKFADGRPFFFFRHSPLPETVSSGAGRGGDTVLTDKLRTFPNCIAFNGHTHWTYNDERSIWQGGFTAVSIPSMSYTTIPKGYENGSDARRNTTGLGMRRLPSRDDLKEAQGYFVSLYDGRLEIERHDFEIDEDSASCWIVPLPIGAVMPYAFAEHAEVTPAPFFPGGAEVHTEVVNSDTRNGRWTIFVKLELPSADAADGGRVYDYEARIVSEDGRVLGYKRFLSPGFYKPRCCEPAAQTFLYDGMDVPESGRYRFEVVARNCFGAKSQPIVSTYRESAPGKDHTKYRNWDD